jgi:hypothetical protein
MFFSKRQLSAFASTILIEEAVLYFSTSNPVAYQGVWLHSLCFQMKEPSEKEEGEEEIFTLNRQKLFEKAGSCIAAFRGSRAAYVP